MVPVKNGHGGFYQLFPVKKLLLRDAILGQLRADLAQQAAAAALAHDEATNEESRARSKYDTHSQEAAYLAQGQAKLVTDIEVSIEAYAALPLPDFLPGQAIALGALVELENRDARAWYFLGPRAGGMELTVDGRAILVLTPQSPLGRQLLGRQRGDTIQAAGRGGAVLEQRITAVE